MLGEQSQHGPRYGRGQDSPFIPSGYPGESDSFLETAAHSLKRPSVPWNGRLFPCWRTARKMFGQSRAEACWPMTHSFWGLTATQNSIPEFGAASDFNDYGDFKYTPNVKFVGTDSFEYIASDAMGSTSLATVTLNVHRVSYAVDDGIVIVHGP